MIEKKQNVFEPQVKALKDYKNILMLAYYRNSLVHCFINEAYIACSLRSFGEFVSKEEGISV